MGYYTPSLSVYASKRKDKGVPLQARSGPEGSRKLRFPDFMTIAQDGCNVVSLTHQPTLPPGNAPGTHFRYRLSWSRGHSVIGRILRQWKIPMTPAGIKPATFQFVAQHLNHRATAVPVYASWGRKRHWECLGTGWGTKIEEKTRDSKKITWWGASS